MKLRRNIAATMVVLMLSTIAAPALAASETNGWYNWILSLFDNTESDTVNVNGSGLGKPPPKH